jgi:hypothetical protein
MILFYILAAYFLTQRWGYFGLALAQPIQAGLVIILLGVLLLHRLPSLSIRRIGKHAIVYVIANLAAALVCWGAIRLSKPLPATIQLAFCLASAGISYLTLLYWLDREMTLTLFKLVGITRLQTFMKLNLESTRP